MNRMSWAAVLLVLTAGQASATVLQPHRDLRDDHWGSVVHNGAPAPAVSSAGDWTQRTDFASVGGTLQPVAWSPPPVRADFGDLPAPALASGGVDPLGPMPPAGDTGAALAGNIAVEDGLGRLGEVLAVPEPSALLMMLAGLGAIAFVIRRRINEG